MRAETIFFQIIVVFLLADLSSSNIIVDFLDWEKSGHFKQNNSQRIKIALHWIKLNRPASIVHNQATFAIEFVLRYQVDTHF